MILIWAGVVLMVLGTLKTFFVGEFRNRLHTMGVSDTVGTTLVALGMMVEKFEIARVLAFLIFVLIWNPLVVHILARVYTERLRR